MHLKQSTSVVIPFGPFTDKTDGVTLETGLVSALDHASTGIMLSKNGGALAVRHATVTASTYDAHGIYRVTLDTTDTATLGTLRVIYTDAATCLPVWADFMVLPANVYDSLYGSDKLQTDLAEWLGVAPLALSSQLVQSGLSGGERDAIAAAYLDYADAIESGITPRKALRGMAAVLVGLLSGGGTSTRVFKGINVSTTRVTAETDVDKNRISITLNL